MRLALDHHYSPVITGKLRAKGHDVVAAMERGWHALSDGELLETCRADRRTLLTNNVADFVALAATWAAQGRSHPGLIFTDDARLPRSKKTIGLYVRRLDTLLSSRREMDLVDQILWLSWERGGQASGNSEQYRGGAFMGG